jgi:hypothetical protein
MLAILAAGALAVSAACGKDEPAIAPTETPAETSPSPTLAPEPSPSPEVPAFRAPLTGLPVEETITSRPFAVMINNLAPARPQSGMTQADVVWELLAEGGITRFVAVFQSKEFTDPIGPVRSIRPYFIEVGDFYNGIHVHAGASNDGFAILRGQKKHDLDEITNAGAYFWRDKSRKAPHNVYTDLEKLRAGAAKLNYPLTAETPVMTFSENPDLTQAESATQVDIKFQLSNYKVRYTYDPQTETYARYINDEPHIDKNNNQQLTASNLVVIRTKHKAYDAEGRLEVDLKSGGEAILIQRGKAILCEWVKDRGIVRLMKDGKELPFVPGVTYYHVVPASSGLTDLVKYQ